MIIGYDLEFADRLPQLFPARSEMMKHLLKDTPGTEPAAFRNSALQGAYPILAARHWVSIPFRCLASAMPPSTRRSLQAHLSSPTSFAR
ncbi:hypothetical protein [Novosphingobium sp. Rr 2-17]|uniref:hypothetical protein n=1 Tax=Novosphingobium sp. Rr 2-17 TaxID=555793 RepID=UPI00307AB261